MSVQLRTSEPSALATVGSLVTLPVHILLAIIEWVLFDVIGRICSWVIEFPLAIGMHVTLARQNMSSRIERERAANAGHVLSAALAAQIQPFAQALAEIEKLDARHAQGDPHFQESLEASRLIFEQALRQIEEVASSDALRERLLEELKTL